MIKIKKIAGSCAVNCSGRFERVTLSEILVNGKAANSKIQIRISDKNQSNHL